MTKHERTLVSKKELRRLRAAEEACMTALIQMAVGAFNLPADERQTFGDRMDVWAELAEQTGLLRPEDGP